MEALWKTTRKFRVKPAEFCRNEDERTLSGPWKARHRNESFLEISPYILVSLSTSAPELKTQKSIEDNRNGRPRRFIPVGRVTVGVWWVVGSCWDGGPISANRRPRTGVDALFHILNVLKSMEYKKPWSYLDKTDVTHKINKIHSFTSYPDSAQYTLTGEALWIEKSVYSQKKRNIWWVRTFQNEIFPSGPCQPRIPFVWRNVLRKAGRNRESEHQTPH